MLSAFLRILLTAVVSIQEDDSTFRVVVLVNPLNGFSHQCFRIPGSRVEDVGPQGHREPTLINQVLEQGDVGLFAVALASHVNYLPSRSRRRASIPPALLHPMFGSAP